MRLFLGLSKAHKEGLVAIKKQVVKKGKVFTQTFYVKQAEAPKPMKKPVVKDKEKPKVEKPAGTSSPYWNAPDGFYVIMPGDIEGVSYQVKIPDEHIAKSLVYRGRTFYVARALEGKADKGTLTMVNTYRVYDPKSGWAVTPPFENPKDAYDVVSHHLSNISDDRFNKVIDKAIPITSIEKVYKKPVVFNDQYSHLSDYDDVVDQIISKMKSDNESIDGVIEKKAIFEWANDKLLNKRDLRWFLEDDISKDIMVLAVKDGIDIDDAKTKIVNMNALLNIANSYSDLGGTDATKKDDIEKWAKQFDIDLTKEFNADEYEVSSDKIDLKFSGGQVVGYAIDNNVDISESISNFASEIEEAEEAEEDEEAEEAEEDEEDGYGIGTFEYAGKEWTDHDVRQMGYWVNGENVKPDKDLARSVFDDREHGSGDGVDYAGSFVEVVENHLIEVNSVHPEQTVLWRGTRNLKWADSVPGSIVPFGMASFSTQLEKAKEFTMHDHVILVMDKATSDSPIVGVDVRDMYFYTNKNESFQKYGITGYLNEHEFVVMTPALEILKVETNPHNEEAETGHKMTFVYVKPAKMNLVQYMKSVFESTDDDLIDELAKTFDYPIGREPEDAWS